MKGDALALAGRLGQELGELARVVERVQLLADKAARTGDDAYWDGVALNLHAFYTGLEHVFESIARSLDEAVPQGRDWHRDLLLQMGGELPGVRPAVLGRDTRLGLEPYRGFRHVVRDAYAFALRPEQLRPLVDGLPTGFAAVRHDLDCFLSFLVASQGKWRAAGAPVPE